MLPKVFINKIDKSIKNNKESYYYKGNEPIIIDDADINVKETFDTCDYFIMISSSYPSHKFFDDVNVGDYLKLTGDITSGNCEFTLIE